MADSEPLAAPISLFYSYSHKDEALRKQLETHLSLLKDQGDIRGWHDRGIEAGTEWDGVIGQNLEEAGIILLLVSADFLASPYCKDVEIARAMERHEAGTARVIPVILRPVDWHSAPFGRLQALPRNGRPVTMWKNRDEAFTDVARSIREVATHLASPKKSCDTEGGPAKGPASVPAPFLSDLPRKAAPQSRQSYRDKVRAALSEELCRAVDDASINPQMIADALKIDKPDNRAKMLDTILDQLLDQEDSIPLLNKLIRRTAGKGARKEVIVLENCLDLILPFHFAPKVIADASSLMNTDGGGFLQGVVMTKCGAELLMAALDQFHARFDPNDPELGGKHAIERGSPPLGKMSIDDDARRFLRNVLQVESEEAQAKRLRFDALDNDRKTYCILRLMEEGPDRDHMMKLLERASQLRPELPIIVLTSKKSKDGDSEEVYLTILRRRFEPPRP